MEWTGIPTEGAAHRAESSDQRRDTAHSGHGSKQSWCSSTAVLCPGTFAYLKHDTQCLSCVSFNCFFVFQGSTVAREASDKEKVSTLT